ncbi:TetR/AcrR family transcriptional regulator [Streptomyces sp. JJ38]|uniref:TetR/AcrR family transcriptional regulator n=1 Tax=Streptomyces sp. JJ38 TaxID=2738128 RepID=UPI00214CC580|nr:TetR/AcrR family transcriptional regulator [Streptomyces sp. JJ38]MBW1598057.1 TetR/AcrR family transcriptional regulator [Streptomyces sp. JJ38]
MASQVAAEERQRARITPRSQRGVRTRNALVLAAREVFERDGYLDARTADIAKAANVATGSFYTYFNSKEEIFEALVARVQDEMLQPRLRARTGITDARRLIDAANREYLQAYERNARLMALFEQVAQINEKFRDLRIRRNEAFAHRNARMIRSLQEAGEADLRLDPLLTAYALGAMVSRLAYMHFVLGCGFPFEQLVQTLNRIWENSLQLGPSTSAQ